MDEPFVRTIANKGLQSLVITNMMICNGQAYIATNLN